MKILTLVSSYLPTSIVIVCVATIVGG